MKHDIYSESGNSFLRNIMNIAENRPSVMYGARRVSLQRALQLCCSFRVAVGVLVPLG